MKTDVLKEPLKEQFESYLSMCATIRADVELIRRTAVATAAHNRGKVLNKADLTLVKSLEDKWYAAIDHGYPDYTVYNGDQYLAEVWFCWSVYSRKYLNMIAKICSTSGRTIQEDIGKIRTVVDLGCGAGYTSAALASLFPSARVFGTNIPGTMQWKISEMLGSIHGFSLMADIDKLPKKEEVDLVFASEYFEHFEKPIEHLKHVLKFKPKMLLIANTFGSPSIGHFKKYIAVSKGFICIESSVAGPDMSKLFNFHLKASGYIMEKTKLWNNRPMYWKKLHRN